MSFCFLQPTLILKLLIKFIFMLSKIPFHVDSTLLFEHVLLLLQYLS